MVFLLVLFVFSVGINVVANSKWMRTQIKDQIAKVLEEKYRLQAEYSNLQLSVIPPRVGLYGLVLKEAETGVALGRASRIDANVSFLDLFFGRKRASLITVSDLRMSEPLDKLLKRFSVKGKTEKREILWPPDIPPLLYKLRLINISASYGWRPKSKGVPYNIQAQGLNAAFTFHSWNWIDADLGVNALNFSHGEAKVLDNARIETSLHYKNAFVRSENLTISSEKLSLNGGLKGTLLKEKLKSNERFLLGKVGIRRAHEVERVTGFRLDVDGNLNGDLGFLGALINAKKTYGMVEANSKFSLEKKPNQKLKWNLFADVFSRGAVLGNFKLLDSRGIVEVDASEVRFRDFNVFKENRKLLSGDGYIKLEKSGDMGFKASTESVSLSDIMHITGSKFDAVDFDFKKQDIEIFGKVSPFQMDIQTSKGLENLTAPTLNIVGKKKRESPDCSGQVLASIDKDQLVIKPTTLKCSRSDDPSTLSSLKIGTKVHFREHSKLDVRVQSGELSLGLLSPFFSVDAEGSGKVDMRISSPQKSTALIAVGLDIRNSKIAHLPLGRLSGRFKINGNKLTSSEVKSITSAQKYIRLKNSKIDIGKNVQFSGEVDGRGYTSSDMKRFFDYVFNGSPPLYFGLASIKGKINGPLLKPLRWSGGVVMDLRDLEQSEKILLHELKVRLERSSEATLNLPKVEARYEGKRLAASGALSFGSPIKSTKQPKLSFPMHIVRQTLLALGAYPEETIKLSGVASPNSTDLKPFNFLRILPVGAEFAKTFNASGDGFGDFTLSGSVLDPKLSIAGKISRLQMHGYTEPTTDILIGMDGLDIEAKFSQPGLLKGEFKNRNDRFDLDLEAKQVNLGWLFPPGIFTGKNKVDSMNELHWKASGSIADFWHANGELSLFDSMSYFSRDNGVVVKDRTSLESRQKSVRLVEPVTIVTSSEGWNLREEAAKFKSQNIDFVVKTQNNDLPSDLNVSVEGSVDLGILPRFNTMVESGKGIARFEASVAGALDKPVIKMKSKNTDPQSGTEVVLDGVYPGFDQMTWDVVFDSGLLSLRDFKAKKGAGSLRAQGNMQLDPTRKGSSQGLKVTGTGLDLRMPAPYLKTINAKVSMDMYISGRKPPYLVSGTTSLDSGFANRDFDLEEEVLKALRAPKYSSAKNVIPVFKYRFDVDLSNGFSITNNNINSTLKGDLVVRGDSTNPSLRGRVYMDGGTFSYKREFNISRANVEFLNPESLDPELDISGYTDLPGRRIFLTIQGPLSEANVDMVADPSTRDDGTPLTKLDVFILLTTGSLPSQSEFAGRRGSAAQVELINFFASTVNRPLERLMEISGQRFIKQPSLEFELSETSGQIIPKLRLPIDVYDALRMNVGINTEGAWEVSTEVPLNRSISLRGSLDGADNTSSSNVGQVGDDQSDAALDMTFRFRFR